MLVHTRILRSYIINIDTSIYYVWCRYSRSHKVYVSLLYQHILWSAVCVCVCEYTYLLYIHISNMCSVYTHIVQAYYMYYRISTRFHVYVRFYQLPGNASRQWDRLPKNRISLTCSLFRLCAVALSLSPSRSLTLSLSFHLITHLQRFLYSILYKIICPCNGEVWSEVKRRNRKFIDHHHVAINVSGPIKYCQVTHHNENYIGRCVFDGVLWY